MEDAGFTICAEAGNADDAITAARRKRPHVCLFDIKMPGNGLRAAAEILSEAPEVAVVMLTVSRDDADLFQALRVGARGYLLKDMDPKLLPDALRAVLRGEAALPGELAARVIEEFRRHGRGRRIVFDGRSDVELSAREWDVLELLGRDYATEEIAAKLFITPATVRNHVSAVLRKLRVPDRRAALRLLEQDDGRAPGRVTTR